MLNQRLSALGTLARVDITTEILKQCGTAATRDQGNIDKVLSCVKRIMKGPVELEDGDEEEAEQDEMLFEYAGEIIPNLGKAMTPATFAPYFTGLLPMLLKKTKKNASISERSFSVGAIAESVQPLCGGGVLAALPPHILPMLGDMCRDPEDDCRNNAVYGLGELLLWGGQEVSQHRDTILVSLSQMLKVLSIVIILVSYHLTLIFQQIESAPRVVDNIIGAIARAVIADVSGSAVEDIVTAVTANLPLKEDTDEYDTVFKMFAALLAAQHPAFPRCLAKMVESAAVFYSDPNTDKVRLSRNGEEIIILYSVFRKNPVRWSLLS